MKDWKRKEEQLRQRMQEDPAFAEKVRAQRKERSRTWRANHPEESKKRVKDRYHERDEERRRVREEKHAAYLKKQEEKALAKQQKEEEKRRRREQAAATFDQRAREAVKKYKKKRWESQDPEWRAGALLKVIKSRAKSKGLPFDLTKKWLSERAKRGCEATGRRFDFTPGQSINSMSVDRIDSSKGYTQDNCRVVVWGWNMACGYWGEAALLNLFKDFLAQGKKSDLQ